MGATPKLIALPFRVNPTAALSDTRMPRGTAAGVTTAVAAPEPLSVAWYSV